MTEEQVLLWRQVPFEQLEEVACNKGNRKTRAAKRKDEVTDVGKKSDNTKLQEEKPEKKTIETAARKRQRMLLETLNGAYGVSPRGIKCITFKINLWSREDVKLYQ